MPRYEALGGATELGVKVAPFTLLALSTLLSSTFSRAFVMRCEPLTSPRFVNHLSKPRDPRRQSIQGRPITRMGDA